MMVFTNIHLAITAHIFGRCENCWHQCERMIIALPLTGTAHLWVTMMRFLVAMNNWSL